MPKRRAQDRHDGRRRITRNSTSDNLNCSMCCLPIPLNADHVELKPCGCCVCPECLLIAMAQNSSNELNCSACDTPICRHHFHKARQPRESIVSHHTASDKPANIVRRPIEALISANEELISSSTSEAWELLLVYSVRIAKPAGANMKSAFTCCIKPFVMKGDDSFTESDCFAMQQFGAFISKSILPASRTPYDKMQSFNPSEFITYKVDTFTPLTSFLFGLGTGNSSQMKSDVIKMPINGEFQTATEKWHSRKTQSEFFAIAAASDLILRSTTDKPCHFQLMFGRALNMVKLPRPIQDLLSISRLAPSRDFNHKSLCRTVADAMLEELKIDYRDVHILLIDNLGYQDSANHDPCKRGYRQYSKIFDLFVSYQELKEAGLYSDDPSEQLSRKGSISWEQLHEEKAEYAERLTTPTARDIELLTECTAQAIQIAIEDVHAGRFSVGSTRIRSARVINKETRSALLAKAKTSIGDMSQGDLDALITSEYQSTDSNIRDSQHRTLVSKKNVSVFIIKQDLSKKSTIRSVANYVSKVRHKMLESWRNRDDNSPDSELPLAEEIGSFILCDGQPAVQFANLFAEDALSTNPSYEGKIYCFMGAFHTLMKLQNASGYMFSDVFETLTATYRKTANRVKWVQFPGDDRQRQQEDPELTQAVYGSAAKQLSNHTGVIPSVKQVHDHLLDRAKKYPFCMLVLLYCRYVEVQKMMKMSERIGKRGSVELFFATLRIALSLYATTHKTDYVRLICDFFTMWECASPAMRVLYEKFLFTQLGSSGESVFSDLFVEQSIRETRHDTGKKVFKGLDAKLEQSVHTSSVVKEHDGDIIASLRNGAQPDKTNRSKTHIKTTATSPLLAMYKYVHDECQLFHATDPPIIGTDESDGSPIYAEEGSNVLPNGSQTNVNIAYASLEGSKRARDYIELNNLETKYKVGRSEEEISLKALPVTAGDILKDLAIEVDRKVSLDFSRLKEVMNKPLLVAEIESTRLILNLDLELYPPLEELSGLNNWKKPKLIQKLIELRTRYFEIDDEAKQYIEERTKQEFEEKHRSSLTIDDIMSQDILHLNEEVMAKEEYCIQYGAVGV